MSNCYKAIVIQDLKVSRQIHTSFPDAIKYIKDFFNVCRDRSLQTLEFDCVVHGPHGTFSFEAVYPLLCLDDE